MTTTFNAVFQGGGVKGIGLVGALARVEQEKVQFAGLAGTSAGSIVAALYAAGYSSKELKDLMMKTNFASLLDPGWPSSWQLWRRYGIHKGQKLYEWIYELLRLKNIVHFQDLKTHDLKVIASDIRHKSILVFEREHYPSLEIAEAVRMSIGIPFFFEAYRFGQRLVVDGGLLSNYPLWAFEHSKEPTLGFKLVSRGSSSVPRSPSSFPQFLVSLVSTMLEAHDKEDEKSIEWARTIHIPAHDVATTNFNLDEKGKELLYLSGFLAADEYIKSPKGGLAHPASSQASGLFESLDRMKKLPAEFRERVFRPTEVGRKVAIDWPNAELEVLEDLTNMSEEAQFELTRHITTDTPTEKKDLHVEAWVKLGDVEQEAAVQIDASKGGRFFKIQIRFKGRVVGAGKAVQLRWKCRFPASVQLNEDYWVFPLNYFEKRPEKLTVEVTFTRIPVDLLFFAVTDAGLRPMSLAGPSPSANAEKACYGYSVTIDSPMDFYLLRWRLE